VVTWKLAVAAPAATTTSEGTDATAGLLLDSATESPPTGAGPARVTVPAEAAPPATDVGESASAEIAMGCRVSVAVWLVLPNVALTFTGVAAATGTVLTVKLVELAPAATTTVDGTTASVASLLASCTIAPEAPAGPFRVTVP